MVDELVFAKFSIVSAQVCNGLWDYRFQALMSRIISSCVLLNNFT